MPTYLTKQCKFYSCNINLQDNELSLNDELIIAVGNHTNSIIFEQAHLDILLTGVPIQHDYCNISYDLTTKNIKIESLLPDHKLYDCVFRRSITNRTYNFAVSNKIPYQLSLDLTNKNINTFDKIIYYVDGTKYSYTFTESDINAIKSVDGLIVNQLNHKLILKDFLTQRTLYICLNSVSEKFTYPATYFMFNTGEKINSYFLINPVPNIATVSTFYGSIAENDIITLVINGNTETYSFDKYKIQTLRYDGFIQLQKYIIKNDPTYHHNVINDNLTIQLNDFNDTLNSLTYFQPKSYILIYNDPIIITEVETTTNPSYDHPIELQLFTRSQLDHIKGRCVCSIRGVINALIKLHADRPSNLQEQLDQIMDYKVYPSVWEDKTKQYIYDKYGPFTSPRP